MLQLKKTYIVFNIGDVTRGKLAGVKGLNQKGDGTVLGKIGGVYLKFDKCRVVAFGSIGDSCLLCYAAVDQIVSNVTGATKSKGRVVMQVFHGRLPTITSSVKLALLHSKIAARPMTGLVSSTLDYQVSDKLIVKLSPYQDGFALTARVGSDGTVEIAGDARGCKGSVPGTEKFRQRCEDVLGWISNY